MPLPIGTIINVIAVIFGSIVGLFFKGSINEKYLKIVFQSLGLITTVLGISMAIQMGNPLVVIFAVLIGGIIGELVELDKLFDNVAERAKVKFKFKEQRFTEGLVTAFLLFCIGSMTILGSIQEGTNGAKDLLITKSVLDGFASIALASTFGIGVLFSVIPLFIFQATITVMSSIFGEFIPAELISYMSATGGILILGVGINLLEIKKINVVNLLPSLIVVILIYAILTLLSIQI